MNYASILNEDFGNGTGVGITVWVSGCSHHCKGCFSKDLWDYSYGDEWTVEVEDNFLNLADKPYISRITLLGGDPLADNNVDSVENLIHKCRVRFGHTKKIWVYTGYTFEEIVSSGKKSSIQDIDVLVDGRFEEDKKDLTLKFRGSSNQRIIDVPLSLQSGEVVLYG